jgi:hypothetical protein
LVAWDRLIRYFGNGPPPPSASAVATVARIVVSASVVAKISDRRVWNRLGMCELLFCGQDTDSDHRLCSARAEVNYC